jgi:hypothetical protein
VPSSVDCTKSALFEPCAIEQDVKNLDKINIWLNEIQRMQQFYLFCYDVKELAA